MTDPTPTPQILRKPPRARLQKGVLSVLAATGLCLTVTATMAQGTGIRARPSVPDTVGEFANFAQWQGVAEFIDQVVARNGFNRAEVEALLKQTHYVESAIQLMKPAPPGRPKNWRAYRARFVEPVRINAGVAFWNQHAEALARAEAKYGVPAEIIVGIIGVETVYGRNTGSFRVMDAVTTLAFAYPNTPNRDARMAYFRGELENTLLFARESGIDPFSLLGSYAGAIGWPQFMPGSIRQFAVDFDGNGKIDLRNSPVDAIGSVANFLVQHGWKAGMPIVFPASLRAVSEARANLSATPGDNFDRPVPTTDAGGIDNGNATPESAAAAAMARGTAAVAAAMAAGMNAATAATAAASPVGPIAPIAQVAPMAPLPAVAQPAGEAWQKFIAQSLEAKYSESTLRAGGVVAGMPLPSDLRYGLVDLQNGTEPTEFWLGTENFFAITQYNRIFFYAMSVVDLGRAVRIARSRL